jgi:hypothetical protein
MKFEIINFERSVPVENLEHLSCKRKSLFSMPIIRSFPHQVNRKHIRTDIRHGSSLRYGRFHIVWQTKDCYRIIWHASVTNYNRKAVLEAMSIFFTSV